MCFYMENEDSSYKEIPLKGQNSLSATRSCRVKRMSLSFIYWLHAMILSLNMAKVKI